MRGPDVGQSWMLLVAGVLFMGGAVGFFYQDRPFDDGVATTGTVTEFRYDTDINRRIRYERSISFTAPGNRTVTFWEDLGRGSRQPVIGEQVDVSYRPGNPGWARVVHPPSADKSWTAGGLFALSVGLVLTGLVGVVRPAIRSRRSRRAR